MPSRIEQPIVHSFIHGNEFIVVNTIGSLSCYPNESCGHVERLEWLAWFILIYRDVNLSSVIVFSVSVIIHAKFALSLI